MALRIYRITENNTIERSKDITNLENYENNKEIFRASLLTEYFNVVDKTKHYFVVHDDEELIEKIHEAKYKQPEKKKLKNIFPNKKPLMFFNYQDQEITMKLKKDIQEYDLKFEIFNEKEKYRVIKRNRFSEEIIRSKWITLKAALTIKKMIEKNNELNKNERNIEVCSIESLEKRMNNIYRLKNKEEEHYVLREIKIDEIIELNLKNKLEKESIKKDDETNFLKIKSHFLIHILKNVRVKANFKTLQKEKWGEKILIMETKIKEFNKNQFSLKEQKLLLNRIFPSMIYDESQQTFINEQRLKDNSSTYLIKNYKFNVLISIIKKSKDISVIPNKTHYKLLDEALRNHNLKSIEKTKSKKNISNKKKYSKIEKVA